LSLDDAYGLVERFVDHYNRVWLHSAIGYAMPGERLANCQDAIFADRDRKLTKARQCRALRRHVAHEGNDARNRTAE